MKIVLIACVSKKLHHKAKAKYLYCSPFFKYSLKYAQSLNPDKIFVLSAKLGLVDLEQEIEPYEMTLNEMKSEEIKKWSDNVLEELEKVSNLENDEFIFLAGENYRKYLLHKILNYKIPMKGLGIGKQLGFMKKAVKDELRKNKQDIQQTIQT